MAETEREASREATREGLDAAARKGNHGGRPAVINDMIHTVLRRRAAGEPVEKIRKDLIIPTGKRKGHHPSLASIYRASQSTRRPSATPPLSNGPAPSTPPSTKGSNLADPRISRQHQQPRRSPSTSARKTASLQVRGRFVGFCSIATGTPYPEGNGVYTVRVRSPAAVRRLPAGLNSAPRAYRDARQSRDRPQTLTWITPGLLSRDHSKRATSCRNRSCPQPQSRF